MLPDLCDRDIGIYRLETVLGQGQESTVYVAHSTRDGQRYAFKILHQAGDRDSRLLRQLVMALESPHVVKIHDYGTHEGHPWLVRELVVGRSLDQILREVAVLGRADAVDIALQAAAGLQAYQANGMAHGALHPGNILLTDALVVRLCDPCVRSAGAAAAWWVAPEIATGGAFDQAGDQFSLAAVMHRALTGRIRAGADPWAGSAAGQELVAVFERMLAPDPAARFPSLAACIDALRQAAIPPGQAAVPAAVATSPVAGPVAGAGAAATGSVAARPGTVRAARPAARSQLGRIDAAAKRVADVLAEAERALAAGDVDGAGGHAERANAIAATLAGELPASAIEAIVAMRKKVAAAREAAPKKPWWKLFG